MHKEAGAALGATVGGGRGAGIGAASGAVVGTASVPLMPRTQQDISNSNTARIMHRAWRPGDYPPPPYSAPALVPTYAPAQGYSPPPNYASSGSSSNGSAKDLDRQELNRLYGPRS